MSVSPPEQPHDPIQEPSLARVYVTSGLISVVVTAVMCVAGFFAYDAVRGESGGEAPAAQGSPGASATPTPAGPIEVSIDDDPMLGDEDAPVTIVAFMDFQ